MQKQVQWLNNKTEILVLEDLHVFRQGIIIPKGTIAKVDRIIAKDAAIVSLKDKDFTWTEIYISD